MVPLAGGVKSFASDRARAAGRSLAANLESAPG